MKYIITENRLNDIIFNYLDDIKWDIFDYTDWQYGEMTRLFFKGESQSPEDAIFATSPTRIIFFARGDK